MKKIVAVDPIELFPEHLKALKKLGEVVLQNTLPKDTAEIVKRTKDADVIIDFWTALPGSVIEKLDKPKMICSAAAGYDWIDIKTATKKGITVTHCPGHSAESVAEHTVGLMLNAMRFSQKANSDVKKGTFNPEQYKGKELKNKTVGIIGYGSIGKRVAEILEKGFGAKILYINSSSSGIDLDKLLEKSDVISVNAPLNDKTRNLLSHKEFKRMKPGVVFVNTGRGAIVDEEALLENLKTGKIFAAGLDTLAKEPVEAANPLLSQPNVIVTPHIGWNTEETEYRLSSQVAEIVSAYIKGKPVYVIPEQKK